MPIQVESLRQGSAVSAASLRPSNLALRQSVLNFFGNQICSTDQGQTIYNDTNTFMINNLRLEVENDIGWLWSESQDIDYSLDRNSMLPAQGNTSYAKLAGPSYAAFQGIESGAINGAPLTNDLDEFGNATLGAGLFNVTVASSLATTGTQPTLTFAAGQWTGNSTTVPTSGFLQFLFSDGRVATVAFNAPTGTATGVTAAGGVLTINFATLAAAFTIGGVDVFGVQTQTQASSGAVLVLQAVGSTNVLNQSFPSEEVSLPLVFTGSATAGHYVLTNFGGSPTNAIVANLGSGVYGQSAGRNPNFNQGFLDRVTVFQNDSVYTSIPAGTNTPNGQSNVFGADVWNYVARIPLKLLHDYWMQLNFPIINVGFNLQLYFAQPNGVPGSVAPSFPVFQTDANSTILTGGSNVTPNPQIFYGKGQGSTCRLYYRSVKFSPADNARTAQMLTTGFTKSVKFISTDWNQMQSLVPANNTGAGAAVGQIVQYQITNSVVHPLRLWVLSYLVTSAATANAAASVNVVTQPWYAPGVITGSFINTNVNVNNIPYFRQPQSTEEEQWEQLREQFNPDEGSMIRYVDWQQFKRYLCMDLTRLADRLQSPTEPVSLAFVGFRDDQSAPNTQLQPYYLVERLNQVTFRFSSSDVAIVVGNLD